MPFNWQLRTRTLPLGTSADSRPLLMGIVNITPDSFSDGGQFFTPQAAVAQALHLLDSGADLLDLGGESTRPNATPISAEDEQARILPVLTEILRARPQAILSVDTYHAATARAVIQAGAEIINDVSGLLWDPDMAQTLADLRPGCILMHTRGRPHEWPTLPLLPPSQILPEVLNGLRQTLTLAQTAGIPRENIVLDPGFGFGKLGDANWTLLHNFAQLHQLGYPLLAGLSRKRFLTATLPAPTLADRDAATHAAHTLLTRAGAHILRTHTLPPEAAFTAKL